MPEVKVCSHSDNTHSYSISIGTDTLDLDDLAGAAANANFASDWPFKPLRHLIDCDTCYEEAKCYSVDSINSVISPQLRAAIKESEHKGSRLSDAEFMLVYQWYIWGNRDLAIDHLKIRDKFLGTTSKIKAS